MCEGLRNIVLNLLSCWMKGFEELFDAMLDERVRCIPPRRGVGSETGNEWDTGI